MLEITPFPNSPLKGVRKFVIGDSNEVAVDGDVDQVGSVTTLHQGNMTVQCLEFIDLTGRHLALSWPPGKILAMIHDVDRHTLYGAAVVATQGVQLADLELPRLGAASCNCNCNCNCNSERWRIYARSVGREALYSCNCNCNCNCNSAE
jgi:hypothetical protein